MSLYRAGARGRCAGIDAGAAAVKAVVTDAAGRLLGSATQPTGGDVARAAQRALASACHGLGGGPDDVAYLVATGMGRDRVTGADERPPSIACLARAGAALLPDLATLLDVGADDTRAVRLDPGAAVAQVETDDGCPWGLGRLIESAAELLSVDIAGFAALADSAEAAAPLRALCPGLAEAELVALVSDGTPASAIARGVCEAVARRLAGAVSRVGAPPPLALVGGVARLHPVVRALAERLGVPPIVPDQPVLVGALGAALLAVDRVMGVDEPGRPIVEAVP